MLSAMEYEYDPDQPLASIYKAIDLHRRRYDGHNFEYIFLAPENMDSMNGIANSFRIVRQDYEPSTISTFLGLRVIVLPEMSNHYLCIGGFN